MVTSSERIGPALLALCLPFGVGGGLTPGALADPLPESSLAVERECEAAIEPSRVTTSEYPVHVFAELSEPIGDGVEATASEESGIVVQSTEMTESPTSFEVVLDTSDAEPGEWTLTLRGDAGECRGAISVVQRSRPESGNRAVPSPHGR